jgi:2-polyprenyl-6-methoxyphenol hydroxylase-like FAD-dependent oxidoreductase
MPEAGDHAVVLGASVGGLLAARVLADAYRRVTIVERDPLPESVLDRKGVPQGRHAHGLLTRGAHILDELFPGLLADLAADGVPVLRAPRVGSSQGPSRRQDGNPASHYARPAFRRPRSATGQALCNVSIRPVCVVGLVTTPTAIGHRCACGRARAAGLRRSRRDLVVGAATGRGGRTPAWLRDRRLTRG